MTTKPTEYSIEKRPGCPGPKTKPLHQRITDFWSYVNKNGPIPAHCPERGSCWVWLKSCLKSGGYGQFNINGDMWRAHVLSYVLTRGDIPDGIWICHHCDNPKCVNPDHLFPGTPQDDMTDMIKKGRAKHATGEDTPCAKFSNEQVSKIKEWIVSGKMSKARIARMFGTDRSTITKIAKGKLWASIPFPNQQ